MAPAGTPTSEETKVPVIPSVAPLSGTTVLNLKNDGNSKVTISETGVNTQNPIRTILLILGGVLLLALIFYFIIKLIQMIRDNASAPK